MPKIHLVKAGFVFSRVCCICPRKIKMNLPTAFHVQEGKDMFLPKDFAHTNWSESQSFL